MGEKTVAPVVVMTGGGIKGAVLARRAAFDNDVVLLHVDYGQRSAKTERKAVAAVASTLALARVARLSMPHLFELQQQLEVTAESRRKVNGRRRASSPKLSVSTLRGLMPVLVSTGVQAALRIGASAVHLGLSRMVDASHVGLPVVEGQPARGREFVHSFNIMVETLLPRRSALRIEAPLMDVSHAEILKLGARLNVPFESTWTCVVGNRRPCGRCDCCRARASAFTDARLVDPATSPVPV